METDTLERTEQSPVEPSPQPPIGYESTETAPDDDEVLSPRRRLVNARLVAFLLIVAAPFVVLGYQLISFNGGVEKHAGYDKIDLKSLGYFVFDQEKGTIDDVPAKWRAYDGKKVALEGFIYAGSSAAPQVHDCQFVYNVAKCCFSGPPQVQERVYAHTGPEHSLPNNSSIFCRLIGTLHVKVIKKDGTIQSVYNLDVDHAEPIAGL